MILQLLDFKSQEFIFIQIRFKWKTPFRVIKKYVSNITRKDRPRLSSSVSFSILIHITLIASYFGLAELEQPVEIPIKEISFIDLSEPKIEPVKKKGIITVSPVKKTPPIQKLPKLASNSTVEKKNPKIPSGKDRLFLDSKRKQVPIKIDHVEPVRGSIKKPTDLLKISPAKGLKNNNQVSRPIQFDLNKEEKLNIARNTRTNSITSSFNQKGPEINFNDKLMQKPIANPAISLKSTLPKMDFKKTNKKPKATQTYITGPLANRNIINKTIPPFPSWAKIQGVGASISLKFTVMENGTVKENIIVERTSGSSDWDRLVIQSLKKWKFAALNKSDIRHDQTGMITFQFVI